MSTEIWIRIPRELFDDTRFGLRFAADDLADAHRRTPAATHYENAANAARLLAKRLDDSAVGMAIERRDVA